MNRRKTRHRTSLFNETLQDNFKNAALAVRFAAAAIDDLTKRSGINPEQHKMLRYVDGMLRQAHVFIQESENL